MARGEHDGSIEVVRLGAEMEREEQWRSSAEHDDEIVECIPEALLKANVCEERQ